MQSRLWHRLLLPSGILLNNRGMHPRALAVSRFLRDTRRMFPHCTQRYRPGSLVMVALGVVVVVVLVVVVKVLLQVVVIVVVVVTVVVVVVVAPPSPRWRS